MTAARDQKPRYAQLTPSGRGAVATVAVWNADAWPIVQRYFFPVKRRTAAELVPDSVLFGQWRHGAVCEDVVVSGDSQGVEIHCHGGEAAIEAICRALEAAGAALASTAQWRGRTQRDALAIEAEAAICEAVTERTAFILLDQFHGALQRRLREAIDHMPMAEPLLARLVELTDVGDHLTRHWRVVLAGPPNVGKSSLANRLLGYERAIVYDRPGTTRDVLTATTAFRGWAIELADTAGVRETRDDIELQGVERARQSAAEADLVLIVHDVCDENRGESVSEIGALAPKSLDVFNKCDLLDAAARNAAARQWGGCNVSAKSGEGIADLWEAIAEQLVPSEPRPGEAVPFRSRHVAEISAALADLQSGNPALATQHLRVILGPPS